MNVRVRLRRDDGSIIPLVALCMFALLVVLALVIDFGATRSVRRDTRTAADAGSTAGAVGVGAGSSIERCTDAFAYTFQGIGGTQPSTATINSACSGMAGDCDAATSRTAALTVDDVTVRVTNPVLDGSPLMNGTSLGGSVTQTVDASSDGVPCARVGVEVTRNQPAFFRGILGSGTSTFTVHSVARFEPTVRGLLIPPALVALNQSACAAIDAGHNGTILLVPSALGPGIAISDSNGPGCSGTNAILSGCCSSLLEAQPAGSVPGQLQWFEAPASQGYNTGGPGHYIGTLSAATKRTTRTPVDQVYHCGNLPSGVTCTGADPITTMQTQAATSLAAPPATGGPFTTWAGPCDSGGGVTFPSGNVWVNCPGGFTVKGGALVIPGGGTVIFNGSLSVQANGTVRVNNSGALDASGYPIATNSSLQTNIIIDSTAGNAIDISTNSSDIRMAQTMIFNSGGFSLQSANSFRWTPPTDGDTKSLLYWSESADNFHIQGGPQIFAKGIVFDGNAELSGGGGGTIDLTKVQMWVDTISLGGSTTVKLSPDPDNSIKLEGPGSALIR